MREKAKRIAKRITTMIIMISIVLGSIMIHDQRVMAFDMPTGHTKMNPELKAYVEKICEDYYLCPDLVIALAELESQLDYDAVSSSGCVGLCQISPKWNEDRMKKLSVTNLKDPYQNTLVCCDILAELFDEYGEVYEVLMFYNMGYNGITLFEKGKISEYARDITERSEELERIREMEEIAVG